MALKTVAETNKAPMNSSLREGIIIPFRFATAATTPTDLVAPGGMTISRTSSTVYVLTIPQIRSAPSSTGTGSALANSATCSAHLASAEYVSSAAFAAVTTAGTTTVTLTLSGAPANGTQVRGYIQTNGLF